MIIEPILLIWNSFRVANRNLAKVFGRNYSKSIKTIKEQGEIF